MLTLDNSFAALELIPGDSVKAKQPTKKMNPELEKLARKFDEELSEDEGDTFEIEFAVHKRDYYMQKFGYEEINRYIKCKMHRLTEAFVTFIFLFINPTEFM